MELLKAIMAPERSLERGIRGKCKWLAALLPSHFRSVDLRLAGARETFCSRPQCTDSTQPFQAPLRPHFGEIKQLSDKVMSSLSSGL